MDRDICYVMGGDMVRIPAQDPPVVGVVVRTPPATATFVQVLVDGKLDWWHRTDCEIVSFVQEG
tara:strand:+ start:226 stop:417 length:192 start_codon:yes stop_codon:yes gene_type:complete